MNVKDQHLLQLSEISQNVTKFNDNNSSMPIIDLKDPNDESRSQSNEMQVRDYESAEEDRTPLS